MGRRLTALLLIVFAWSGAARAGELAGFNAAIEAAASHNRVALGYLRTGNAELAVLELEQMREAWAAMAERYAGNRPAALQDSELFSVALVDVPTRIVGTFLVISMGRPDVAAQSLQTIRQQLSAMRRAAGIEVLADCVLDANAEMTALAGPRDAAPDWENGGHAAKAGQYRAVLARCDGLVAPAIRRDPEFRRLIDGAAAALALIPETVRDRDAGRLHRILIELRAFDHLLSFRYG